MVSWQDRTLNVRSWEIQRQYANMLRNDAYASQITGTAGAGSASQYQGIENSIEGPKARAFRLLAEAKKRHPEWEVKKLLKPLDTGEQV